MAEVLTPTSDGQGSFYNSRKSSPASSSLFLGTSPPLSSSPRHTFTPPPPSASDHTEDATRISTPPSTIGFSSRASSSDLSSLLSQGSTLAGSVTSLEHKYSQSPDFDEPDFPQFDSYSQPSEPSESSDSQTESATTDTTASDSPLPTPSVSDDTAIKTEPSQHVDYLSHDWREEDVWSSWRHIVSQRKVYGQQSRLENAAWRTWVKSKFGLPTVSPETLNWLKESDVTWLYGPLKPATSHPLTSDGSAPDSNVSRNASFVNKKPILKKRSMSEVMLQRSLSASSLLKQAAASIQAQGGRLSSRLQPVGVHNQDYVPGLNSTLTSRDQGDYFTSRSSSSGAETPSECRERRHIRFDEHVEQCIAVECKHDEEEEEVEEHGQHDSSSDSDGEGLVMMKRKKRPGLRRNRSSQPGHGSRSTSRSGRKMIETVASTTLKYRTDSPTFNEEQQQGSLTRTWSAGKLSPSPSQETLRPTRPSRNFLLDDEEQELHDSVQADAGWSFGASNPKSSLGAASVATSPPKSSPSRSTLTATNPARASGGYHISRDSIDEDSYPDAYGMEGMHRTESGMFMPYEEDEDDVMAAGLFGRISEGVNTARDIAHVLWNVGWRNRESES